MLPVVVLHHHEIVLKGENRRFFERMLMGNIRAAANRAGSRCVISGGYGRFILDPGADGIGEALLESIGRVFGIANVCPGVKVAPELETISAAAEASLGGREFRTLRVETRRVDKRFPLSSMATNAAVGAQLCSRFGVRADLSRPDVTVSVEIVDGNAYVYSRRLPGAGGLPTGASGKVVGLLSAGFDSPVACWRMMRRGCSVVFAHFHSMPYTGPESLDQVREIVAVLTGYQFRSRLYVVPFADVQNRIVLATEPSVRILLYRRMMLRIAGRIAAREKAEALVTGESVGQVASQTLRNIRVIGSAAEYPVLRPLSGADKEETIAEARAIGTHDISSRPSDDCCSFLAPRKPATWAAQSTIDGEEAKLDVGELAALAFRASTVERFGDVQDERGSRRAMLHA